MFYLWFFLAGHVVVHLFYFVICSCRSYNKFSASHLCYGVVGRYIFACYFERKDLFFGISHPTQEFFTHMETSLLPVKSFKFWPMLGYHRHCMSSEGSLVCHTYSDTGHPFTRVISEDLWHSLLLQVSFFDQNLSVIRRKLFTLSSSSPEPLDQFQPNLAQSILG